jgi:hypothetical protein
LKICLNFSLAQNETNKVADFSSVELKSKYVEDEFRDMACQDAYFAFQAARSPAARKSLASKADDVRYSFFNRWAAKHMPEQRPRPMHPVDDIA